MSPVSEHDEQAALCAWLWAHRVRFFAVPNGARLGSGKQRFARMATLKKEGLTPGAPDLVLVDLAPCDGRPVAIEVKRAKGGRLSSWQKAMREIALGCGWHYLVARGYADGVRQLRGLGYGG